MEIQQFKLKKMDTFCYLIGDKSSKTCALIDPAFETKRILNEVKKRGYHLTHVVNTHFHFDHSAGNSSVLAATDAKLLIHHLDSKPLKKITNRIITRIMGSKNSPSPDILLSDGDKIKIGKLCLNVIHTPGHTHGSICLYTEGHIFTGDTLFVNAIGRTDLPGGSHKLLLQSVKEKLYTLPEETRVWPGHDYGPFPYSSIKYEKKTNPFILAV